MTSADIIPFPVMKRLSTWLFEPRVEGGALDNVVPFPARSFVWPSPRQEAPAIGSRFYADFSVWSVIGYFCDVTRHRVVACPREDAKFVYGRDMIGREILAHLDDIRITGQATMAPETVTLNELAHDMRVLGEFELDLVELLAKQRAI